MTEDVYGSICDPHPKAMAHLIIACTALNVARASAPPVLASVYAEAVKAILAMVDLIEIVDQIEPLIPKEAAA